MNSKRRQEHNQEKIIHKETFLTREAIDELNASQKERQDDIAEKEDRIAEAKARRAANQPS